MKNKNSRKKKSNIHKVKKQMKSTTKKKIIVRLRNTIGKNMLATVGVTVPHVMLMEIIANALGKAA